MEDDELFDIISKWDLDAMRERNVTSYSQTKKVNELNHYHLSELVNLVNSILAKHGIEDTISENHIRFNNGYIGNPPSANIENDKLSNLIFNKCYPPPARKTFSHYTGFDSGALIINKETFRLYDLRKNISDGEFSRFYKRHKLEGYKETVKESDFWAFGDYNLIEMYNKQKNEKKEWKLTYEEYLMSKIFSLSLTTEENTSELELWNYFGQENTGLKLTFEVESKIADFRQVYYPDAIDKMSIPLLKELFEEIEKNFGLPFNFRYISKVGAFYIDERYSHEQEYRFLIKINSDNYDASVSKPISVEDEDKEYSYIELPFKSDFAIFKLIKVEKGVNCSPEKFNELVKIIQRKYDVSYPESLSSVIHILPKQL